MILSNADQRLVLLAEQVVSVMHRFSAGPDADAEAGGILLGSYRGPHIEVTECTVPQPGDVRSRFLFDRKDASHRRLALEAWQRSGNVLTCVGEWHTHPEDFPSPSWIDRRNWRKIMRWQDDTQLFFIVGRHGIWSALGTMGTLTELRLLETKVFGHMADVRHGGKTTPT